MPEENRNPSLPGAPFTERVKAVIRRIPRGRVVTYGQVAWLAGYSRGTRQVVWVLHSCADKENLPWHRVINHRGGISLRRGAGYELQKRLLETEGVIFDSSGRLNLERYRWEPGEDQPL